MLLSSMTPNIFGLPSPTYPSRILVNWRLWGHPLIIISSAIYRNAFLLQQNSLINEVSLYLFRCIHLCFLWNYAAESSHLCGSSYRFSSALLKCLQMLSFLGLLCRLFLECPVHFRCPHGSLGQLCYWQIRCLWGPEEPLFFVPRCLGCN